MGLLRGSATPCPGVKIAALNCKPGGCPGKVLPLYCIMSAYRAGGAAAAGAVLACLSWAWAVSAGAGAVLALLLSAYTLAAFGDSSPPCSLPSLSVVPFCASPARLAIIQSDGSGRGVSDFAILSFALSPFSLVYAPLFCAFWLFSSVILSFYLSDSPF